MTTKSSVAHGSARFFVRAAHPTFRHQFGRKCLRVWVKNLRPDSGISILLLVFIIGLFAFPLNSARAQLILKDTIGHQPVCVDEGRIFTSGNSDCSDNQGRFDISALTVGPSGSASVTVLDGSTGNILVGTGTGQTILNASNGGVSVGGPFSVQLSTSIDLGNNVVSGVAKPVSATDAANKAYVDSLVNGGNRTFTTLVVTGSTNLQGETSFGNAAQTTIDENGNIRDGGTLTVAKLATFNGGTQTNGNAVVTGNTRTGSLTVDKDATVGGTLNVTGKSNLNGGATVSNNFTVTPGTTVDFGGNVVGGVGAPILGTDAANKAYVDSGLNVANRRIDRANQGIAIASSMANPDRTGDQTWALAANWGNYEGYNAFSASAIATLGYDIISRGDQVSFGGAVGFGLDKGQVAGRVSLQIAGGGRVVPLK